MADSTAGRDSAGRFCGGRTAGCRSLAIKYALGEDALGIPDRIRYHTDDSIEVKYYDHPESSSTRWRLPLTGDTGCETRRRRELHRQQEEFGGKSSSSRVFSVTWSTTAGGSTRIVTALTLGGGKINNPGRYLVLLPPINGATAASGTPYFTENPGDPYKAWDAFGDVRLHAQPVHHFPLGVQSSRRQRSVFHRPGRDYASGRKQRELRRSMVAGLAPDLRKTENRATMAMLVKF